MNLKIFSNLDQKIDYFLSLQEDECTYIVADLESKKNLQNLKFEKKSELLEENFLLRVNEFWKKVLFHVRPEISLVSKNIFLALIKDWSIQDNKKSFLKMDQEIFNYMEQLMPLISEDFHRNILSEWFKDNTDSYIRWGKWYELSYLFWKKLENLNFAPTQFLPALLLNTDIQGFKWKRKIIFDLSVELTPVEAKIIQKLSEKFDVTVIDSRPTWFEDLKSNFNGYTIFNQSKPKFLKESDASDVTHVKLHRLNTELSEVKTAVSQIRKWLDRGVLPREIAVCAPDIETYWVALNAFFKKEGIPCSKPTVSALHLFPQVLSWLAFLRVSLGSTQSGDLELGQYGEIENKFLGFNQFKNLFSIIYGKEDLHRESKIKSMYDIDSNPEDILSRDEFISFCLKHWTSEKVREVKILIEDLLKTCQGKVQLSAERWMSVLEKSCAQLTIPVEEGEASGVSCLDIMSMDHSQSRYVCFLGLSEKKMKIKNLTALSERDIESVSNDAGFDLSYLENSKNEYYLRWATDFCKEVHYITSNHDFLGEVQAPSNFWIFLNNQKEKTKAPGDCLWTELQHQKFEDLNKILNKKESFIQQIEVDCGRKDPLPIQLDKNLSLSATDLKYYAECPFIFASKKLFCLDSLLPLDMDVSPLAKGSFVHALFEKLIEIECYKCIEDEKVDNLLEELYKSEKYLVASPKLWPLEKNKYKKIAIKFSDYEKEWREKFSLTKSVGLEIPFEAYWDLEEEGLSAHSENGNGILFKGKIDRIDTDGHQNYIVIDYKLSGLNQTNYKSWLDKDDFQLCLYSQIIESGIAKSFQGDVVSAAYYNVKDLNRDKGFRKQVDNFSDVEKRKGHKINETEKQELFKNINKRVQELVKSIVGGEFASVPKDEEQCNDCYWRLGCRAKHLNR